jgi:hypothetical protein
LMHNKFDLTTQLPPPFLQKTFRKSREQGAGVSYQEDGHCGSSFHKA